MTRGTAAFQQSLARGFTYLGVMFLIFLLGLVATAATDVYKISLRRERESDLIFVGTQYKTAIEAYRQRSGKAPQPYPKDLSDLLRDPRQSVLTRYLRRVYTDPMNPGQPLVLIRNGGGGIIGVYSPSTLAPIRQVNLPEGVSGHALSYRDWKFIADGATSAPALEPDTIGTLPSLNFGPGVGSEAPSGADSDTGGLPPSPASRPIRPGDLAPAHRTPQICGQLYAQDQGVCNQIANTGERVLGSECLTSAALRNSQCASGEPLSSLTIRQ